ncbi:MAG: LacI family DNA-binding transcriptional regulator [Thermaceae bacterium]|nr:LacI family DNA-binding transcriptional regulator [Thermaceae bacterium]
MPQQKSSNSLRRITSHEVALRAGVSQSTVSRVFSGDERLSEATRERVLGIARDLGYKPNAIARSLITRRTKIIGLVASYMTNPFFPVVLQAFTQRLHELGWRVLLFTAGTSEDVDELLPEVLAYQVDGLIIVTASLSSQMTREVLQRGTPVVLFNRYAPGSGASAVSCANYEGGRLVAEVLLDAGHKRLAYITGRADTSTNVDRQRGFLERLAERKSHCKIELGNFTYAGGFDAALRLLKSKKRPDAIFCANDITALGALDAARKLGVRVPDELSVIGFDDIPMAQWTAYDLTTVRQPVEEMIEASVELLLERVNNINLGSVLKFLPGTLVRRGSARLQP